MYCAELANKQMNIISFIIALITLEVSAKIIAGLVDFPLSRLFNAGYALFLIVLYIIRKDISVNDRVKGFLIKAGDLSLEHNIVHVAIRNIMGH